MLARRETTFECATDLQRGGNTTSNDYKPYGSKKKR